MALDVRIKNLNSMLGKEAFMEMFVILYQSKPGFQELVICLHVYHVVFVKLRKQKKKTCYPTKSCLNFLQVTLLCLLITQGQSVFNNTHSQIINACTTHSKKQFIVGTFWRKILFSGSKHLKLQTGWIQTAG